MVPIRFMHSRLFCNQVIAWAFRLRRFWLDFQKKKNQKLRTSILTHNGPGSPCLKTQSTGSVPAHEMKTVCNGNREPTVSVLLSSSPVTSCKRVSEKSCLLYSLMKEVCLIKNAPFFMMSGHLLFFYIRRKTETCNTVQGKSHWMCHIS